MKKTFAALLFSLVLIQPFAPVYGQSACVGKNPTVILSLDGFRWDYTDHVSTPNFDLIANEGVKAVSLIPSFPSKTFPNHYTIATGLYPDHHGLVSNSFYDGKLGKAYGIDKDTRYDPAFYGGEPIWITAQKQGLRTASFFWVGTDVAINGMHPDSWKAYDGNVPFIQRVDTIVKWLSLPPERRPCLILAYYHEPDATGHSYGPYDVRTLNLVHQLDSLTGILYTGIKSLPVGDSVNLIIVSDHGMGEISPDRVVNLRQFIPESWPVRIEGGNPNYNIYAASPWSDSVWNALQNVAHIKVWRAGEVPAYLHYGNNPRDGNIIVVADSAWSVLLKPPRKKTIGGTHGYDITDTDVHAIFYAAGPAFKKGYLQPSFRNVDIYPLLAHLLGIIPAKSDGDLGEITGMLKP